MQQDLLPAYVFSLTGSCPQAAVSQLQARDVSLCPELGKYPLFIMSHLGTGLLYELGEAVVRTAAMPHGSGVLRRATCPLPSILLEVGLTSLVTLAGIFVSFLLIKHHGEEQLRKETAYSGL